MPRSDPPLPPEQPPGPGAVLVGRDNTAAINTGTQITTYQTIIQQAAQPGASAAELRGGYLAWVSMRANELPLLAAESGRPVQLSSVYTALLTEGRDEDPMHKPRNLC
jgi:hypothetical protein